jgi:hypothetical protein
MFYLAAVLLPSEHLRTTSSLVNPDLTSTNTDPDILVSFSIRPARELTIPIMTEDKLLLAQQTTAELFKLVEQNNLIIAGKSEEQLNREITALAKEKFGITTHWHKKIVRAGINTMAIYPDNPADRIIQADDIVILDYGPVVNGWEADYARTFVLGHDARKLKLKADVEKAWYEIQAWYHQQTFIRASDLFAMTRAKAKEYGWASAGDIAGHIVGQYPHEQPADPKSLELDIHPDNPNDMLLRDAKGNKRHWILEVHFVDTKHQIGGYIEQLL